MDSLLNTLKYQYGITIKDPEIVKKALTHSSYANERHLPKTSNNERLEFLGDAVLSLVVSRYLFETYPNKPEGELSKMRSSIVRTESLAKFAKSCQLDQYMLLGHGEEATGGRQRATNLEDLFEAFLGALLVDQGVEIVAKFIDEVVIRTVESGDYTYVTDYKTALQELLQAQGQVKITYSVISESGPAHAKTFEVVVSKDDEVIGQGSGKSKKTAEQAAAKDAIERNLPCT